MLLCLFVSQYCIVQNIESDDTFTFEIESERRIGLTSIRLGNGPSLLPGKGNDIYQIRINVSSLSGKKELFDSNKLYFLNENYKVRFRPTEIKFASFLHLGLIKSINNRMDKYVEEYNEYVQTYNTYFREGYEDHENVENHGTKRKPSLYFFYYQPKKIKQRLVDVFFIMPDTVTNGSLFYGFNKIGDLTIE